MLPNPFIIQRPPLSVKTLTMAPGGVETSVLQNTIVPESFSFGTPGMRIFKLFIILLYSVVGVE